MSNNFDLPADAVVPFPYTKWSPVDWIEGTEGFELELEGAYCRFLNRLYRRGRALPDDDRFMCQQMALSLRVWKRIKAVLIELKKIITMNGCLTNPRFEKERLERAAMLRKQSEAALATHDARRQKNASLVKFEQSLAKTSSKLPSNLGKKSNKINESDVSEHGYIKSKRLEVREESSLRSDSAASPSADAAMPELELDDPGKIVWAKCVPWLTQETGKSERNIKTLVGKWQKTLTHHELLHAFRSASKAKKSSPTLDPVQYIGRIVSDAEEAIKQRCRRENGRLVVVNGFAAEIGELLKGRDVQRDLDRINGKIGQHVVGIDLEARVRSLAIELVDEEKAKDRRYAGMAEKKNKSPDEAWLDKMLAEDQRNKLIPA